MTRPPKDLSNRLLFGIVGVFLALGLLAAVVFGVSAAEWARPGSPLLQSLAIAGGVLLLASFAAVLAKRFGQPGKRGFHAHVGLASIGFALVLAHWSFQVIQFPTFLILILLALVALGVWSRSIGAKQMAGTFGRKHAAFLTPSPQTRERLRALIGQKQALLASLDPAASEATFSLQPRHWLRTPGKALAYQRLCDEELGLTSATNVLSRAQRQWRLAHRLLAWAFVAGLGLHVLLVLFFAGYVAGDGEVYWWHITAWDF